MFMLQADVTLYVQCYKEKTNSNVCNKHDRSGSPECI